MLIRKISFLPLILMVFLIMGGCQMQPVETYYRGYKSVNDSNASLGDGGARQGQWRTFDLRLEYSSEVVEGNLLISGNAVLSDYYQTNTLLIRSLDLYLFILDENFRVIKTVKLSDGFMQHPEDVVSFAQEIPLTPGASAFAFGYDGEAYRDGGDRDILKGGGGGLESFYDLPRRSG